jgi:hypothetical protein
VVSRRPDGGESAAHVAAQDVAGEIDRAARGQQGRVVARRTEVGVGVDASGWLASRRLEEVDQRAFVNPQDLRPLGRRS